MKPGQCVATDMKLLKGQFKQKRKGGHYLLAIMSMESLMKFRGRQNSSGASQQNSATAFSLNNWLIYIYILVDISASICLCIHLP